MRAWNTLVPSETLGQFYSFYSCPSTLSSLKMRLVHSTSHQFLAIPTMWMGNAGEGKEQPKSYQDWAENWLHGSHISISCLSAGLSLLCNWECWLREGPIGPYFQPYAEGWLPPSFWWSSSDFHYVMRPGTVKNCCTWQSGTSLLFFFLQGAWGSHGIGSIQ